MPAPEPLRQPTSLALDPDLVRQARDLGVSVSAAAEDGLRQAVAAARSEAWRRENADAIASSNAYVSANGLPLDRLRRF